MTIEHNMRDPRAQQQNEQFEQDMELPAEHSYTHKTGGDDEITPGDIQAETPSGAQSKVDTHESKDNPHSNSQPIVSGTTANRPSVSKIGYQYFDTDLGYAIWWNGSDWVDATGTVV